MRRLLGRADEKRLEELEELFYRADLGVATAAELVDVVRRTRGVEEQIAAIRARLLEILEGETAMAPGVVLVIGVNGSGKTTTVAKLAHQFQEPLLLAAADTFRAAAIDQLQKWADQVGAPLIRQQPGGDPAAVVFDALAAAKARGIERVIVDTAGRLHTKSDLMEELRKMRRVCDKQIPGSPHETLLVLDATIGQNAIEQARAFHEVTPITGLVLAKMDGTARGGIAVAIKRELDVPIKFIGVGEGIEDLQPFDPTAFVDSLLG